jgi:UDP-N-acetylglucosamine--N-acetylmuramyl-(pentapeptide) pyrophosphoryl-undecaprenol N-acetylglucosamine transferase
MKALMVGGGTGGHVYPAIAIAQVLQDLDLNSEILFVGSDGGIETKIVPNERFTIVTIRAKRMLRKLSFASIVAPFYSILAFFDALKIIRTFKPQVIVATGGFVSLPVVVAGSFNRVPIVLFDGNIIPGLSARICKWFASRILIAFGSSKKHYLFRKVYCIGGPVRKEILKAVKGISIQNLGLRQDKRTVLVIGGSQGARSINKAVVEMLPKISDTDLQVLHISGDRDHEIVSNETLDKFSSYKLLPYMHNIWDGLAAADIVVSRAGATAISEIIARGLPSIIIPFPYSANKHQQMNAALLGNAGAAVILKDEELSGERLFKEIMEILNNRDKYTKMQGASKTLANTNASNDAVNIIYGLLKIDPFERKKKAPVKRKNKKPDAN